jgi:hypothetical protein
MENAEIQSYRNKYEDIECNPVKRCVHLSVSSSRSDKRVASRTTVVRR